MKIETSFILEAQTKDEAMSKLKEYMDRIKSIKKYEFIDSIMNKIQTVDGYDTMPLVKQVLFKELTLNEESLAEDYEIKRKDIDSPFFKRFSNFEEYRDLCSYFYTPVIVFPDAHVQSTKSYYSSHWIRGFEEKLKRYKNCYIAYLTIRVQLPQYEQIMKGVSVAVGECSDDFLKAVTNNGHECVQTVHADGSHVEDIKECAEKILEEKKNTPIFTVHANPVGVCTMANLIANALKNNPDDIPLIDKIVRNFSWAVPHLKKTRSYVLKGIDEKIIALIHYENGAWQYVNRYHFVTESGKVYVFENSDDLNIESLDNESINKEVKDIEAEYLFSLNNDDLKELYRNLKKVVFNKNEKGKNVGCAFDAGSIKTYVINDEICSNPVLVRLRGDMMVDSIYKYNKEIAEFLSERVGY